MNNKTIIGCDHAVVVATY